MRLRSLHPSQTAQPWNCCCDLIPAGMPRVAHVDGDPQPGVLCAACVRRLSLLEIVEQLRQALDLLEDLALT